MADRQFRSITFPGLPNRYVVLPIENLAPAYSNASTYTVGDIVSYNNKIYRCIANISTPEGFSASHWAETTLGTEVEGLEEETGEALDLKLDKRIGTGEEVYTHTGATQGGATLTETPTAGAVPMYGEGGVLKAAAPVADNDVVRKAEMDEVVEQLSDSTTGLGSKASAIINTASGAIASFSDGAGSMPVKKLVVAVEPVQDLHGYDNPWPAGGGVNLCPPLVPTTGTGLTITANSDGSLSVSGTATASGYITEFVTLAQTIPSGTAFVISIKNAVTARIRAFFDNGVADIDAGNTSSLSITQSVDVTKVRLYLFLTEGTAYNFTIYFQLEKGTAPTAWSPYSNICPISGWTGAEIEGTGLNLLKWYAEGTTKTQASVTGTVQADGGIKLTGTASGTWWGIGDSPSILLKAGTYSINQEGTTESGIQTFVVNHITNIVITSVSGSYQHGTFTLASDTLIHVYNKVSNGTATNCTIYSWINLGSTATAYEPFQSKEISVTFPSAAGTVYGATLTVNPDRTGTLVVDERYLLADGVNVKCTVGYAGAAERLPAINISSEKGDVANGAKIKASYLKYENVAELVRNSLKLFSDGIYIALHINDIQGYGTGKPYSTDAELQAAANAYLQENNLQIVYPLASPITYTLTASEIDGILTTLYGTNNIWADCGDTSVTYAADTKLYIEHLTQPTEDDMTADHAISAGTFFMLGNTLYLATSQIAAGGTITPGTNATQLSLADALNQLNT